MMSFSPFLKTLCLGVKILLYGIGFSIVLVVLPGIPPNVEFNSFKVTPSVKLEGRLAPQYLLDNAVKFVDGELSGAESIVIQGDTLYTGVAGGKILKLEDKYDGKKIEVIAQIGKPCDKTKGQSCPPGVPAGIRLNSDGNLVVVDCTYGIAGINLATGAVNYYFTTETPVSNGKPAKLPNDLDIAKDGTIYWSDFSSSYYIEELSADKVELPHGRLLKFDPKTKTNTELISGLYSGNGVQLSQNEEFVLVGESFKSSVSRYYLKGPKAGTNDIFVDGLPGLTDNIRPNGKGGFYITLFAPRLWMVDKLSEFPLVRKLIFRLQWLTLLPFKGLSQLGIQNPILSDLNEYVSNFGGGPAGADMTAKPVIVEVDYHGNILRVLSATKNEMQHCTQFTVGEKNAYMGGLFSQQIWKISLEDLNAK